MAIAQPSRKQLRKCAKLLREFWHDDTIPADGDVGNAWEMISDYRSSFQRPLDKVTIQLRRYVSRQTPGEAVFVPSD